MNLGAFLIGVFVGLVLSCGLALVILALIGAGQKGEKGK